MTMGMNQISMILYKGTEMKNNIRRNTISGEITVDGLVEGFVVFTEWNNGEGFDFEVMDENYKSEKKISLHCDELEAMAALALHLGFLDIELGFQTQKVYKTKFMKLKLTKVITKDK